MFDPPEYIDKINKDKYNYWFLVSFSLLSILVHLLPLSTKLHNTLYSANVFSLIGFTIIVTLYPYRLYNYYGETLRNIISIIGLSRVIEFNIYWLYVGAWIVHFIPVYVFRNKYSLGNPISWILLYFVFAGPFLGKIYNLTFAELLGVFIITIGLLMAFIYLVREYRESVFI
jgi:hypothetical protein